MDDFDIDEHIQNQLDEMKTHLDAMVSRQLIRKLRLQHIESIITYIQEKFKNSSSNS